MDTLTKLERILNQLREVLAPLETKYNQPLLPGKVYRVAEAARILRVSESTIKRAGLAGTLLVVRGRVLGEDALKWYREGAKTSRNKGE